MTSSTHWIVSGWTKDLSSRKRDIQLSPHTAKTQRARLIPCKLFQWVTPLLLSKLLLSSKTGFIQPHLPTTGLWLMFVCFDSPLSNPGTRNVLSAYILWILSFKQSLQTYLQTPPEHWFWLLKLCCARKPETQLHSCRRDAVLVTAEVILWIAS